MSTTKPKYKGCNFSTPAGRASWPAIFVPKLDYDKETMIYSIQLLFPKDTDLTKFQAACETAVAEVFGHNKKVWPKNIQWPLKDQQELIEKAEEKGQGHDQYTPGAMYANFKTKAENGKPNIFGKDNEILIDPTSIYGGCFVQVAGNIKVYDVKGVKTVFVTPYLGGVRFVKDGDRFGSGRTSVDDFEPVSQDDESEDLVG